MTLLPSSHEVTQLLVAYNNGDEQALERLLPLVYDELRGLAQHYLRRERPDHTLQATALVHEAYLRLVDQDVSWQNRAHFFGVAAQMMRRILIDHARQHMAAKRPGSRQKLSLDDALDMSEERASDLVALDDALESLAKFDPQKSRIVELRFFGGLSAKETAEVKLERAVTLELGDAAEATVSSERTALGNSSQSTKRTGNLGTEHPTSSAEYVVNRVRQHKRGALLALVILVTVLSAASYLYFARSSKAAVDSIAVLPFVNESGDQNTEWLSDGITESIINNLSQLTHLTVKARSSVFRYKGREVDPEAVGRELGVQAVLTGRIVQHGDSLTVSTELVDARTNNHIWGEQYNRRMSEVISTQEEIARDVSEKLRLRLTGEEQKRMAKSYTENTEAYQLYLKGRYYWNKRTQDGQNKSIDYFNQALEKDPNYALAYAGLADSYNTLSTSNFIPPREAIPKAKAAAMRALEIDDTLTEAHAALATTMAIYDWDWAGAEREYKRAIELNPNYSNVHYFYGWTYLFPLGRTDEAIAELKRAQELDPLSLSINASLGRAYIISGQPERAIEQLNKTLELDPNFPLTHLGLWEYYTAKQMYEDAITEAQKAASISTADSGVLGSAYAVAGKRNEAIQIINNMKERARQSPEIAPGFLAMVYVGLGDKDEAFSWLEKAYQERDWTITFLKVHPIWQPLHTDPRYADLVRRVGLTP